MCKLPANAGLERQRAAAQAWPGARFSMDKLIGYCYENSEISRQAYAKTAAKA